MRDVSFIRIFAGLKTTRERHVRFALTLSLCSSLSFEGWKNEHSSEGPSFPWSDLRHSKRRWICHVRSAGAASSGRRCCYNSLVSTYVSQRHWSACPGTPLLSHIRNNFPSYVPLYINEFSYILSKLVRMDEAVHENKCLIALYWFRAKYYAHFIYTLIFFR